MLLRQIYYDSLPGQLPDRVPMEQLMRVAAPSQRA